MSEKSSLHQTSLAAYIAVGVDHGPECRGAVPEILVERRWPFWMLRDRGKGVVTSTVTGHVTGTPSKLVA